MKLTGNRLEPANQESFKIIHTEASDGWGGQEIRTLREMLWFRERGHEIELFAPAHSRIARSASEAGIKVRAIGFAKGSQISDAWRCWRLFNALRPDVVATHSSTDSWAGLTAAWLSRVPVRLRYRHVSTEVKPNAANRLLYGCLALHIVTTAECISSSLRANLGLSANRVTTVATGIAPPVFGESREIARQQIAQRLGLNGDCRFLGCVAVLRSWKGQDHLMSAFEMIASKYPKLHVVLAGDGPGLKRLTSHKDSLSNHHRIHLVGHQEDPWPWFRGFDAAVLVSLKDEGIPQSLLQAMFAETPVLGSTVGGIPEIVREPETGWLVAPGSPRLLAGKLDEVLAHPAEAQARGSRALAFVREKYALDRMGETMLRIIGAVAASSARHS